MRDPRERSSDKERTILSCDTFQGRVCTKARARLETRRKNRNRVKFQPFPDPYRATERFFRADPPTRRPYISSSSLPPPQQQIILFPPLAFRLERKLFKIGTTLRDKVKRERERQLFVVLYSNIRNVLKGIRSVIDQLKDARRTVRDSVPRLGITDY